MYIKVVWCVWLLSSKKKKKQKNQIWTTSTDTPLLYYLLNCTCGDAQCFVDMATLASTGVPQKPWGYMLDLGQLKEHDLIASLYEVMRWWIVKSHTHTHTHTWNKVEDINHEKSLQGSQTLEQWSCSISMLTHTWLSRDWDFIGLVMREMKKFFKKGESATAERTCL